MPVSEARHTSYILMSLRALAMVASVSKERRASTSVETTPLTTLVIFAPKSTKSMSIVSATCASWVFPSPWS